MRILCGTFLAAAIAVQAAATAAGVGPFPDGARVAFTYKEFELLRLFLSHPGMAFTRDQLFQEIWGMDYCGETRTVDMHIRTLRQKLGPYGRRIETVRNVGYRMEATT